MPAEVSDIAPLVEEVAGRLRSIQADLADSDEQLRCEQIAGEISDAMRGLPSEDRGVFLRMLGERFPSWDEGVRAAPSVPLPKAEPKGRSSADDRELRDPAWVVDRLIKLCAELEPDKREKIVRRLQEAGLSQSGGDLPADAVQRFCEQVHEGEARGIDSGRVLDGVGAMREFIMSVEKLVGRAWVEMAPRGSPVRQQPRKRAHIGERISLFAAGDAEMTLGEMKRELEDLRKLTAGVILATSRAADFALRQLGPLMPDEIERTVRDNKEKKALEAKEVAFWRKYRELCQNSLDRATFDSNLKRELGQEAQRYLERAR